MQRGWELPENGFIKVNVHAVHYNNNLANGNNSGIGVVLRDDHGEILLMISGSLRNVTELGNELWAMLIGLRCAFYANRNKVMLETESADAVREWNEWRWFHDANNWRVIQQLEKRKKDKKLTMHVDVIRETQNSLARFLALDGAQNRTRMVVFIRPFGRVREIWHLDMGLGLAMGDFDLIEEEDYLELQQQEIQVEGFGDWLLNDEGSANIANEEWRFHCMQVKKGRGHLLQISYYKLPTKHFES